MKIRAVCEYDEEVKSWSVICPELPGLTSCGDTIDQALENYKKAIELFFTSYQKSHSALLKLQGLIKLILDLIHKKSILSSPKLLLPYPLMIDMDNQIFRSEA